MQEVVHRPVNQRLVVDQPSARGEGYDDVIFFDFVARTHQLLEDIFDDEAATRQPCDARAVVVGLHSRIGWALAGGHLRFHGVVSDAETLQRAHAIVT